MSFQRILILYLVFVVLVQALFAAFPTIDLAVSRIFVGDDHDFPWVEGVAPTVNLAVRRLGEAVTFLLIAATLFGYFSRRLRRDDVRLLAYPSLCVALASGGMVNLLLKSHVGRARPDSLAEFGGTAAFSPPWQVVGECARNCSFTSGEVAMAASLAIPVVVILWPHLATRRARLLAVLVAAVYIAFTALLRIGLGRHFLSDSLYSVLFAAGAALVFYYPLRIAEARRHLPILAPRKPETEARAEQRGVF